MVKLLDPQAELRRESIRRFMSARALNAHKWANSAGVPAASLYNFLRGESNSLSQQTLEKLARGQRVSVAKLLGEDMADIIDGGVSVPVIGQITEGSWFADFTWLEFPDDTKSTVFVPLPRRVNGAAGFILRDESYDLLMPDGTILIVAPIDRYAASLDDGDHVMYHRREGNKVERAVRQIKLKGLKKAQLVSHSSVPNYYPSIDIDWPYQHHLSDTSWCTELKNLPEGKPIIIGLVVSCYLMMSSI